jgi:hypothetical protein
MVTVNDHMPVKVIPAAYPTYRIYQYMPYSLLLAAVVYTAAPQITLDGELIAERCEWLTDNYIVCQTVITPSKEEYEHAPELPSPLQEELS